MRSFEKDLDPTDFLCEKSLSGCGALTPLTEDPDITCTSCKRFLRALSTPFNERPLLGGIVYYEGEEVGTIVKGQVIHIPDDKRNVLFVKSLEKDGMKIPQDMAAVDVANVVSRCFE